MHGTDFSSQAGGNCSASGEGLVWMCSGQGAQMPGMGSGVVGLDGTSEVIECASDVFGWDMEALLCDGSPDALDDTVAAQAALSTMSIALASACSERGVRPDAVLGFSLGQISALAISGMLSVEETFKLLEARSRFMRDAAASRPGAMSAILKCDEDEVRHLCRQCADGQVLVPANFNCPGQLVISGDEDAVARAEARWADGGGRYARLATAGAFHSPLMGDAAARLASYLKNMRFSSPHVPVIGNVDAQPVTLERIRDDLVDHLTQPVLFRQSVSYLAKHGLRLFAEVGFGGVLCRLVRRIDRSLTTVNVQDGIGVDELVDKLGQ